MKGYHRHSGLVLLEVLRGFSTLSRVPTLLERKGDFSQTLLANGQHPVIFAPGSQASGKPTPLLDNRIPDSMLSPIGVALANVYPLPNFANNLSFNYVSSGPTFTHRWAQVAKIDWNIDDKTRFFARGTYDYERTFTTGPFPFTPGNASWRRPDRALSTNLTRTMTPNLIMENLFAWQMDFVHHGLFNYDLNTVDRNKLGLGNLPLAFPNVAEQYLGTNPPVRFLPQVINTGFTDYSFARFPWYAKAPEWQASSTWSWIHGTHFVKFGAMVVFNKKNEWDASAFTGGANGKGSFDFGVNPASSFDTGYMQANLLTGAINSFKQADTVDGAGKKGESVSAFYRSNTELQQQNRVAITFPAKRSGGPSRVPLLSRELRARRLDELLAQLDELFQVIERFQQALKQRLQKLHEQPEREHK